jgi:hypothetical protein
VVRSFDGQVAGDQLRLVAQPPQHLCPNPGRLAGGRHAPDRGHIVGWRDLVIQLLQGPVSSHRFMRSSVV